MSKEHRDKWRAERLPDTLCWTLNFDGSCPLNPGPMGVGVVLARAGYVPIVRIGAQMGQGTNNIAEYAALLTGMRLALRYGLWRIRAVSDSLLVVNQYNGSWKARDGNLIRLLREAQLLAQCFHLEPRLKHVHREENEAADELSRQLVNETPTLPAPLGDRVLLSWQAAAVNVWWHARGVRSTLVLSRIFGVHENVIQQIVDGKSYTYATFVDAPSYDEIRCTPVDLSRPALAGSRG